MKCKNTKRNIVAAVLIIAAFLFFIWEEPSKPGNYQFFPRSEIADIYRTYQASTATNGTMTPEELGYIRDAEVYYQNMNNCSIIGTLYQEPNSNFTLRFDWYPPDLENDTVGILKDYGIIKYDMDTEISPKSKDFHFFVCQYKKRDFVNKDLSITSSSRSGDFILGYVYAIYETRAGKQTVFRRPLSGSNVVLPTRDGHYALKEFCVFNAYEPIKKSPENPTQYQVKIDGQEVIDFMIP